MLTYVITSRKGITFANQSSQLDKIQYCQLRIYKYAALFDGGKMHICRK